MAASDAQGPSDGVTALSEQLGSWGVVGLKLRRIPEDLQLIQVVLDGSNRAAVKSRIEVIAELECTDTSGICREIEVAIEACGGVSWPGAAPEGSTSKRSIFTSAASPTLRALLWLWNAEGPQRSIDARARFVVDALRGAIDNAAEAAAFLGSSADGAGAGASAAPSAALLSSTAIAATVVTGVRAAASSFVSDTARDLLRDATAAPANLLHDLQRGVPSFLDSLRRDFTSLSALSSALWMAVSPAAASASAASADAAPAPPGTAAVASPISIAPTSYTYGADAVIDRYGDWAITGLKVRRAPIEAALSGAIDSASGGAFAKALEHNNDFSRGVLHLGITVELCKPLHLHELAGKTVESATAESVAAAASISSDGSGDSHGENSRTSFPLEVELLLEKTEVVCVGWPSAAGERTEYRRVRAALPPDLTLRGFLAAAQADVESGGRNYFAYDAFRGQNCQDHVLALLLPLGDGGNLPAVRAFVKQDVDALLRELPPHLAPMARVLTDVGAAATSLRDEAIHSALAGVRYIITLGGGIQVAGSAPAGDSEAPPS